MEAPKTVPLRIYLFLALGLVAASQSGNLIRLGNAPPVTIAAWRLLLASLFLAPLAGRNFSALSTLSKRETGLLVLAGAAIAAHFFTWIWAVQHTTVANATMAFTTNPVFTALLGNLIFKERITKKLIGAILLGLVGVAIIGWSDLTFNTDHLAGDLMALLASALFTVYFLLGKRLRRKLPNTAYVSTLYGVASLFGFACMLYLDLPFVGFDQRTWICFFLMALVPTVIGHTAMNNSLQYIDASRISTATLVEPLLAGIVAYVAWSETVTVAALAGYTLICSSVVILALDMKRAA
jgi:drug/metabolite transporter (DMT)-like permease